ncbi:unnamed protein product [Caenorhabditis nigoni]
MKTAFLFFALIAYCAAQFSATAKQQLVDAHNTLRSSIAKGIYVAKGINKPSGANILKMEWDSSLEAFARNLTDTCSLFMIGSDLPGKNVYEIQRRVTPLDDFGTEATKRWEREFQDYGWISNTFDTGTSILETRSRIGKATQMVWAKSRSIGCGVNVCGSHPSDKE